MAKPRPFRTYYSDGTQGCSSTAKRASLRAFKKVIAGDCRTATVVSPQDKTVLSVSKYGKHVTVDIARPKDLKED